MLCLSRKEGEVIVIGQNIRIIVNRIGKLNGEEPVVSIGIEAPPEVRVDRAEVRQRILAALAAEQN